VYRVHRPNFPVSYPLAPWLTGNFVTSPVPHYTYTSWSTSATHTIEPSLDNNPLSSIVDPLHRYIPYTYSLRFVNNAGYYLYPISSNYIIVNVTDNNLAAW
jgi:hypothetical protein